MNHITTLDVTIVAVYMLGMLGVPMPWSRPQRKIEKA